MKAIIKEKKYIAKDTLLVIFDLLGKKIDFKPGQFFFINLVNPPYFDEKISGGYNYHFSILNPPEENGAIKMATRIRDSAFKKSLAEMPVGAEVKIGLISGNFTLPESPDFPIVFIAGGIGIAPFMSMLAHMQNRKSKTKITLLYFNREESSAAFLDELEEIRKNMHYNFNFVPIMTDDSGWRGEKRRMDAEFIRSYFVNPNYNIYMIAGSPDMVESVIKSLKEAGVEKQKIISENFSGY